MIRMPWAAPAAVVVALLAGCAAGPAPSESPAPEPSASSADPDAVRLMDPEAAPELQAELLAMAERDQAGRTGGDDPEGDGGRAFRLAEIIDELGWPTRSAVGDDGATAAWLIAQHADLDPDFQRRALEHLQAAVDVEEGSAGDLAYLTDRVATGAGEPQTYGTQLRCADDPAAAPTPTTPIADEAGVDVRRAEAGLPPLADYLAEFAAICVGA